MRINDAVKMVIVFILCYSLVESQVLEKIYFGVRS